IERVSHRHRTSGGDDRSPHGAAGVVRRAQQSDTGGFMSANGKKVDVLIVGAGAYGLSCAWWMAKRRTGASIMVVDQGEFASGASGRNGAGFRMQWGLEMNIRLCQE